MIGASRYMRVVTTVFGEKLGVAWASHSLRSAPTVPSLVERGDRLSVSVTSAASALAAARLFPWNVRSTYRLRLVIGSRPACTRSCHDSSPRCRIEPEMASPRPLCPSLSIRVYRSGWTNGWTTAVYRRVWVEGMPSHLVFYWQSQRDSNPCRHLRGWCPRPLD